MALLRQCLQAVRTKNQEWDVPNGAWPDDDGIRLHDRAVAGSVVPRPTKTVPFGHLAALRPLTPPARPSTSAHP